MVLRTIDMLIAFDTNPKNYDSWYIFTYIWLVLACSDVKIDLVINMEDISSTGEKILLYAHPIWYPSNNLFYSNISHVYHTHHQWLIIR